MNLRQIIDRGHVQIYSGGQGSGDYGHAGRKGEQGGSSFDIRKWSPIFDSAFKHNKMERTKSPRKLYNIVGG